MKKTIKNSQSQRQKALRKTVHLQKIQWSVTYVNVHYSNPARHGNGCVIQCLLS
jgi:hypothetical protein